MAKNRGLGKGFWIAGAMLALFAIFFGAGPAHADAPPSEPRPTPPPATFPPPQVFSPNDAAVYVEVRRGDVVAAPLSQVTIIGRAAAADPLSVHSLLAEELRPLPSPGDTVSVFTTDAHGNVLGSWSYQGDATR